MPECMPEGFAGVLYRALNPVWARQPLSGEGARLYGGRFNAPGVPALYTSLDPLTAIREATQAGRLQPLVLVALEARIDRVFDARDAAALEQRGLSPQALADPGWRNAQRQGPAPTQAFAAALAAEGWPGLIAPSYAPGATGGANLVLWSWGAETAAQLTVIDDEGRLPAAPATGR